MKVRPNTYDFDIVQEVQRGEYRKLYVEPNDIVLDLGAHVGAFTCLVAPHVKKVIAYEVDTETFELLKENTKDLDNVELYNKAVLDKKLKDVSFYRPSKNSKCPNTGTTSIHSSRVRDRFLVDSVTFQEVLGNYQPTKIKCDIEGSEYVIFKEPLVIPDSVKEIIMECHSDKENENLFSYLETQNFEEVDKETHVRIFSFTRPGTRKYFACVSYKDGKRRKHEIRNY